MFNVVAVILGITTFVLAISTIVLWRKLHKANKALDSTADYHQYDIPWT